MEKEIDWDSLSPFFQKLEKSVLWADNFSYLKEYWSKTMHPSLSEKYLRSAIYHTVRSNLILDAVDKIITSHKNPSRDERITVINNILPLRTGDVGINACIETSLGKVRSIDFLLYQVDNKILGQVPEMVLGKDDVVYEDKMEMLEKDGLCKKLCLCNIGLRQYLRRREKQYIVQNI